MGDLKDKATWSMVGAVVAGIINMGIFAMKSDVSDLRAEVYKEFVTRSEWASSNEVINKKLDRMLDILYSTKK